MALYRRAAYPANGFDRQTPFVISRCGCAPVRGSQHVSPDSGEWMRTESVVATPVSPVPPAVVAPATTHRCRRAARAESQTRPGRSGVRRPLLWNGIVGVGTRLWWSDGEKPCRTIVFPIDSRICFHPSGRGDDGVVTIRGVTGTRSDAMAGRTGRRSSRSRHRTDRHQMGGATGSAGHLGDGAVVARPAPSGTGCQVLGRAQIGTCGTEADIGRQPAARAGRRPPADDRVPKISWFSTARVCDFGVLADRHRYRAQPSRE